MALEEPREGSSVEREWQFEGSLTAAEAWLASLPAGYSAQPPVGEEIHDVYFEGEDWRLARAGFTCRIRVTAAGTVLTLKGFGTFEEGARVRSELHQVLVGPVPPSAWPPGPVVLVLTELGGAETLAPLFGLRTQRRTWRLLAAGAPAAAVSLDRCEVYDVDGRLAGAFERVEAEAVGDAPTAARVAAALAAGAGLRPAASSKFVTACRMLGLPVPVVE